MQKKTKEIGFLYGNLLDFPYGINTIAHSCNTLNIMGAGIAKQIADRYPEAKQADDESAKLGTNDLGEFSFAEFEIETKKCKIFNLYTQDSIGFGREVNYEALYRNFLLMRNKLNDNPDTILGLPYEMSSGLAGGSWEIVFAMINTVFASSATFFKTYVVKYEP